MTFSTPSGSPFEIADDWWTFSEMDKFSVGQRRCYPIGFSTAAIDLVPLGDVEPPEREPGTEPFNKHRMTSLLMALSSAGSSVPPIEVVRLPAGQPFRYRVKNGFHRYYVSAAVGFPMIPVKELSPDTKTSWAFAQPPTIYCADIGSVAKSNFGWCGRRPDAPLMEGASMEELSKSVSLDLAADRPVALGFECPLFVPLNENPVELTARRVGEGNRPWSAGAGCGALATGLVQVTWLLRDIHQRLDFPPRATLDWSLFAGRGSGLLIWEAFVSSEAKRGTHCSDAVAAVETFETMLASGDWRSAVTCEGECHSLIGAALLRTGWTDDLGILAEACTVVRALPKT